jgi:plastocyanin
MRVRRLLLALLAVAATILTFAPGALADKQVQAQPINRFSGDVTMDQGENLTFMNTDSATHNVTADANGSDGQPLFVSPNTTTGQTTTVNGAQYLTTGDYAFHCTIHPFMTATLHVTANGTPQPRPGGGGGGGGAGGGGGTGSGADVRAPVLTLAIVKIKLSTVLKKNRLPVKVTVDEASSVNLTASAGSKKLATGKTTFSAAGSKTLRLSLTKAGRRALRGRKSAKVTVKGTATDAAGNKGTATTSSKLRG